MGTLVAQALSLPLNLQNKFIKSYWRADANEDIYDLVRRSGVAFLLLIYLGSFPKLY